MQFTKKVVTLDNMLVNQFQNRRHSADINECVLIASNKSFEEDKMFYVIKNYTGCHIIDYMDSVVGYNGYISVWGYRAIVYTPIYGQPFATVK